MYENGEMCETILCMNVKSAKKRIYIKTNLYNPRENQYNIHI